MNRLFLILSLAIMSNTVSAQKVKIDKGIASVDGKEYLKVGKCGMFQSECSIRNLQDKEIIFIQNMEDPKNPGSYFKVVFLGLNQSIEIKKTIKPFVELLYTEKVVLDNGELDKEQVARIVEKYGNRISEGVQTIKRN